jgi:two-component system cell cycle response regulator DivK
MPEHEIRLLVVAAREYSDTIQYFLRGEDVELTSVDRADQLVDALTRARPTVIAVDCVTPQMNGQAVFRWLRTDGGAREIPALLITVGKSQHKVKDDEATAAVDFADVPMRQQDFLARLKTLHSQRGSPGAYKAPSPAPMQAVAPAGGRGSKTIMIVEDDDDHSNLMRNLLEAEGYKVIQSSNLDAFKNAIVKAPDVLVLDLMMPVMDGFVLAEVFKACRLTRHIPIIFLTALHEAQYVEASRGLQAAAFLTKPVTIANFLFTVDMVLSTGQVKAGTP